jgi:hypothetical protein
VILQPAAFRDTEKAGDVRPGFFAFDDSRQAEGAGARRAGAFGVPLNIGKSTRLERVRALFLS